MNKKQLINSVIVLIILGIIAFFTFQKKLSSWNESKEFHKEKLLTNFDVNKVARLAITSDNASLTLEKKDDKWLVEERSNYPANFDKLSKFLLNLSEVDVVQYPNLIASQFSSMKLIAPKEGEKNKDAGTLLTLFDKDGNTLLSLIVGEEHIPKRDTMNSYQPIEPDGCYVLETGTNRPALIKDPLSVVNPNPLKWLDNKFIKMPDILSISSKGENENETWQISRKTVKASWVLKGIKVNDKILPRPMMEATSIFENIHFEDVSPAAGVDFKPSRTITIETARGVVYTIQLLPKKKKVFAKFAVSCKSLFKIDCKKSETPEEIEKDMFYTNWIYEFPIYKISKVLKSKKEFYRATGPTL